MSSKNKKDPDFDWEEGGVLDDKNYDPIGDVQSKGLPKLNKAVHADPVERKKQRDQKILQAQSQPYQSKSTKIKEGESGVIAEETHSGLSADQLEESQAKKLIDAGNQFKGLDRFGKSGGKKEEE